MPRIRRHKTVQLDTGGWIDLKGCDVLWAQKPWPLNLRGKHFWFPGGVFFARKNAAHVLLRTPKGTLVVQDFGRVLGEVMPSTHWREVSDIDAFLWLQQQRHSRRYARKLFPDVAVQHREHTLPGER